MTDEGDSVRAKYESDWWLIELPDTWICSEDPECTSFHASPPIGVLQISTARKPNGIVTPEDVLDFASGSSTPKSTIRPIRNANWGGLYSEYQDSGLLWRQWWACDGAVLIFVTYYVSTNREMSEINEVSAIVASLKVKG